MNLIDLPEKLAALDPAISPHEVPTDNLLCLLGWLQQRGLSLRWHGLQDAIPSGQQVLVQHSVPVAKGRTAETLSLYIGGQSEPPPGGIEGWIEIARLP